MLSFAACLILWIHATEGPDTWSPYDVLGHLNHAERTDWMQRLAIILESGPDRTFDTFDRQAQFNQSDRKSLDEMLDDFKTLRAEQSRKSAAARSSNRAARAPRLPPRPGASDRAPTSRNLDGA